MWCDIKRRFISHTGLLSHVIWIGVMTHSQVWRGLFMVDMTHPYVWRDVTWLTHLCAIWPTHMCDVAHSQINDHEWPWSFMVVAHSQVTWLIHRLICEWTTMNDHGHSWSSHDHEWPCVTTMNDHEWATSHKCMSHITRTWVSHVTHVDESCPKLTSLTTMTESRHTCEWVISHI